MIIEIILLILAIPVGYLIAYLARDELAAGRKWFRALFVVSVVGILAFPFGFVYLSWTCAFIAIVSLISIIKSKDKAFTKIRFK